VESYTRSETEVASGDLFVQVGYWCSTFDADHRGEESDDSDTVSWSVVRERREELEGSEEGSRERAYPIPRTRAEHVRRSMTSPLPYLFCLQDHGRTMTMMTGSRSWSSNTGDGRACIGLYRELANIRRDLVSFCCIAQLSSSLS
jgi:hypothetical protein